VITVAILINGRPLFARSAVNMTTLDADTQLCRYDLDDGSQIEHRRGDGAVALAKAMLDSIVEPGLVKG